MAIIPDKQRDDEFDNAYGKSQLEGLNYQNIHRRIKSRSEAYQDGQNQTHMVANVGVPQDAVLVENQKQHILQRKKESAQDLEHFHVFHNIILQERAVGQKQAATSAQKAKSQNEQGQHKSSIMGQSLHFVPKDSQNGQVPNQMYAQNQKANAQAFQNAAWNRTDTRKQTIEINARYQVRQVSKPAQKSNMQLVSNPPMFVQGHPHRQQSAIPHDFSLAKEDHLTSTPQPDYFGAEYGGRNKYGDNA